MHLHPHTAQVTEEAGRPGTGEVLSNGHRAVPGDTGRPPGRTGKVSAVDRWLLREALRVAGNPPIRVLLWNGAEVGPPGQPDFTLRIHGRNTLWKLLADPGLGFGDAYVDGRIEVEGDLVAFLETMHRTTRPRAVLSELLARLGRASRSRTNSLAGSRANVRHHYDVGNDFYQLWLDEQMVYTCAYFPTPSASLDEAQVAKMDHVCRKLRLQPGQTVIEAGCGWGSLARHMARHYGVRVRAFNISRQQIAYARQRTAAEGLDRQVEFAEADYRTITGTCDAFVSVGMLEHVGAKHYPLLGEVIHRCLKPSGLGLIHSLGQNRPGPMSAWLEKRVFPGAYIPSLGEMLGVFEPWDFSVLDVENLRLHYAKTVGHWLQRLESVAGRVAAMFDERFVRTWRLYLAGSLAAFNTGMIQLFQVLFSRASNNAVPWTRADVYGHEGTERPHSPFTRGNQDDHL